MRHDQTFIPRAALHRQAVGPIVRWAMTGPPATRGPLDNRAPTRRSARQRLSGARSAMRADQVVLRHRPEVACPSVVVELHRLPLARQRYGRLHLTPVMGREPARSASLRVLILPPAAGLGGLRFRRSLEQEA